MKRFLSFFIISAIIVAGSLGLFKIKQHNSIKTMYEKINWSIVYKGISNAVSFDIDQSNNIYIAFKNNVIKVTPNKSIKKIVEDSTYEIWDIAVDKNIMYIATDNRVLTVDVERKTTKNIIDNIPNKGLNKSINLLLQDNKLYISIGTNTNSGIVQSSEQTPDKPSFNFKLTGENYGSDSTGAFLNYGVSSYKGQEIEDSRISNGSIICYDIKTEKLNTFATGIRNIEGMDVNSEKKITAIFGGIKDEGIRSVQDDKDYIYILKEKAWYGWPDFSGGDPLSSPRFTDGSFKVNMLIQNPPTVLPYEPMYQHKAVSALKGLAIDRDGRCLNKDTIIFADNIENYLYALKVGEKANIVADLGDNSKVEKIIYKNGGVYILDSKQGYIYILQKKELYNIFNLSNSLKIYIVGLLLVIIVIISYKFNKKIK